MNINELREKLTESADKAVAIVEASKTENRALTKDEQKEVNALHADMDKVENQIKEIEDSNAIITATNLRYSKMSRPSERKVPANEPCNDITRTFNDRKIEYATYGTVKGGFTGEHAARNAFVSGQFIRAVAGSEGAKTWLRDNGIQFRTQSEGSESGGSFLVPIEFQNAIISNRELYGVARKWARVVPMSRDTATWPIRTGGMTVAWYPELGSITASNMTWGQVRLSAKKLAGLVQISSELGEDAAVSVAGIISEELGYQFALAEDQALFSGDGTITYGNVTGIVSKFNTGYATLTGAVAATSGHATAPAITVGDLASCMAALPLYADQDDAAFYCSKSFKANVFDRLKANGGGNQVQSLGGQPQDQWLGYPIRVSQVLPTGVSSSSNTVACLFGSLKRCAMIGDRREMTIAQSLEYGFNTDSRYLRATERVDMNVYDIGNTTTAGPVVALIYG